MATISGTKCIRSSTVCDPAVTNTTQIETERGRPTQRDTADVAEQRVIHRQTFKYKVEHILAWIWAHTCTQLYTDVA